MHAACVTGSASSRACCLRWQGVWSARTIFLMAAVTAALVQTTARSPARAGSLAGAASPAATASPAAATAPTPAQLARCLEEPLTNRVVRTSAVRDLTTDKQSLVRVLAACERERSTAPSRLDRSKSFDGLHLHGVGSLCPDTGLAPGGGPFDLEDELTVIRICLGDCERSPTACTRPLLIRGMTELLQLAELRKVVGEVIVCTLQSREADQCTNIRRSRRRSFGK